MTAYYNEIDPFAAAWLRNLISAGHIAPGEVDERSIEDVRPDDLRGFTQCHFFAGIGVWSYALRQAGWPDDRPVWTGSCPCQPFSAAGKRIGFADERHLWPALFYLIQSCNPDVIFGEQVASKDGLAWFDVVSIDLEAAGYTVGAADLCAAGLGAPHIRQRLYFVADSARKQFDRSRPTGKVGRPEHSDGCSLDNPTDPRRPGTGQCAGRPSLQSARPEQSSEPCGLVNTPSEQVGLSRCPREPRSSFWSGCDWLPCIDGKQRPVEPGTFPLAHGSPNRVGRLRGYGNALVAPVAQAFIEAYLETQISQLG